MKKILFIIIALLNSLCFQAQESQVFYYYHNEKIYLDKIENAKVIHFNKTIDALQKDYICNQLKAVDYITTEITPVMYTVSGNMIQFEQDTIVSAAIKNGNILYITDMLMYQDATILWTSNEIITRIPLESDLHNVLLDNRIPVISFRQLGYNKQTYVVELDITDNSAIDYANKLSKP